MDRKSIKMKNKALLICQNCKNTKKVKLIKDEEPKNTEFILTQSCIKCSIDSDGIIRYFNFNMNEISEK